MKHSIQYKDIEGAGGGKGGGGGGSEGPDTLVTDEVVKILHLIGEGEVNLFTNDGQSIFLNNVPLVNPDGTYNFGGYNEETTDTDIYTGAGSTFWEWRPGLPSQIPMTNPAFPSASDVFSIDEEMFGGTTEPDVAPSPVIYAISNADVSYAKVAINFPNGIENVDSNGNLTGDSVEIAIDVAPHATDAWVEQIDTTISYQASQSATVQYQVNSPCVGSLWDIRCRRITQDNSNATRKNQCYLYDVEEVQQVTLSYNGIAYCGLALDAATIGGSNASIPSMSFLVAKGPIAIPSNMTPATTAVVGANSFDGEWDGTWTTGATDDPACILWDMLTNTQYGCGLYGIAPAMIDAGSFYNAMVFNATQVPDGSGISGQTERQFTFNAPIQNRQDMLMTLQQVAGMMNAALGMENGLITLFQDRPATSSYLVTKSSVLRSDDSKPVYFTYSSTAQPDRTTAVNVTWTNASDLQYLPTTSSVMDETGLARYGYNPTDLAAFGATSEGQALRAGRYMLYEALYNTQQVEFKSGMEGYLYNLYDVFDLFDDDYATTAVSGRIVSASGDTVTLDQAVTISGSSSTISVWLPDGVTYQKLSITNVPGTYTVLTVSGAWEITPTQYCIYGVTSGVTPRQFRINDLAYDGVTKEITVTAKLYNPNNYTYVYTGYAIPSSPYTTLTQSPPTAPTNLIATPSQYIDITTHTVQYAINISWTPATQSGGYIVKWQKDNSGWTSVPQSVATTFTLSPTVNGTYSFLVYNVNIAGNSSAPASVSYTQDNSGGGTSTTLTEITDLYVTNTSGDTWTGLDLPVQWTNPGANQGLLKDFIVSFYNGSTLLRDVIVAGVPGGQIQDYTYTYAMNEADNSGAPIRAIVVKVQGQDSGNNTTTGISATMTNPAPAVPSNITATAGPSSVVISWTPETSIDVQGYIVWMSSTSGFTPGSGNATDCGASAVFSATGLTPGTEYYYEVAAYDVFGKSLAGTGLNLSSQLSFTIPTNVGIASGSTLPGSSTTNGFFFDTSNQTLYQWNGSAWVQVGITYGTSLPGSGTTNQQFYNTTNNTLYIWNGTSWVPSINGASIQAATVNTNQLTAGAVTTGILAAGAVETSNIYAGAVTAACVATGTLTATQIQASSITATCLNISTLSAISANIGTVTAGTISNNSGTNTINLGATGTAHFIDTPGFYVTAAGSAVFSGTLYGAIVTAGNLSISTLSSITANIGTITAGTIQNAGGTVSLTISSGLLVLNNGTTMSIKGEGFGASSQFLEWSGPTQSSASNYAACTTSNATSYLTVSGASYFGGNTALTYSGITGNNGYIEYPPAQDGTVIIDQWGIYTQGASSPETVSFPVAFPNNCMNVQVMQYGSNQAIWVGTLTKTGFQLNFGASYNQVMWRAIGY